MHGVITSLSKLAINPDPRRRASEFDPSLIPLNLSSRLEWKNDPCRNPALPIVSVISLFSCSNRASFIFYFSNYKKNTVNKIKGFNFFISRKF
jgi:hypothetical protein